MVSTASTNALPMNCPWRNKLSPSPRPRRGVHIVKVCPVDNIYLLCYTATCLSSIAGAGYSSPFPSHQGVHTRWFGRALAWHARGQRFDPAILHQKSTILHVRYGAFLFAFLEVASRISQMPDFAGAWTATPNSCYFVAFENACSMSDCFAGGRITPPQCKE